MDSWKFLRSNFSEISLTRPSRSRGQLSALHRSFSIALISYIPLCASLNAKKGLRFMNYRDNMVYRRQAVIEERPIDGARPLRVICVGAGISGILTAIRFPQRIPNLELQIYEKNPDITGTWFEVVTL